MVSDFPTCRVVKIDAQCLFSKWYSESGKMVTKLFTAIEGLLDEDEDSFLFVLIDEVESLAGSRHAGTGSNEPKDALRVIHQVFSRIRWRTEACCRP